MRGFFTPTLPYIKQHFTTYLVLPLRQFYAMITPMASIVKRANSWRALVTKQNVRKSASFTTKAEAIAWATQVEAEILTGKRGATKAVTFGKLLQKYSDEVSPTHKGSRWEQIRITKLQTDELCGVKLADITPAHFSNWRDRRLKEVSAGSVRREWTLMLSAVNIAVREWGWLKINPMKEVKRPPAPPARDRLFTPREIELLTYHLSCGPTFDMKLVKSRVGAAMLFALETGMRAGDIAGLTWDRVTEKVAEISVGKTAAARRRVPLTVEARRILAQLPKDRPTCFDVDVSQIDSNFRKAKTECSIENLHFHDSRANAITKLAKQLDILDLARAVGIKDLSILMVYYRDSAETIADRIG